MANWTIKQFNVTSAGLNTTISATEVPDLIVILPSGGGTVVLAADINIQFSGTPAQGTAFKIFIGGFDLNGNNIDLFGSGYQDYQVNGNFWRADAVVIDTIGTVSGISNQPFTLETGLFETLDAGILIDGTVTLDKLANLTSGRIIVGNSSNIPTAVAMSGDATLSNTGALTIANSAITNAKVDSSAAITRSKLATGTAAHVLINDGSGVMSSEAQLAKSRGGFGADVSAANGFVRFNSGTLNISSITELVPLKVSWESGYVGDFTIKMPFDGVVTDIYASLDKAVGAANAVITPKNAGGITMGSGTITFTASDPKGTALTSSPASNNSFVAGDVLTFTTSGGSNAGVAQLSITVTRTN